MKDGVGSLLVLYVQRDKEIHRQTEVIIELLVPGKYILATTGAAPFITYLVTFEIDICHMIPYTPIHIQDTVTE